MGHILKDLLINILSLDEITKLYSSFDIIGDIVIIKIPESLNSKRYLIANTLLNKIKPVNTIFQQISPINGDFRLRKLEFLAGVDKTITEHKEHGCVFKVDVSETYFSPRLSTERLRITKLVEEGEVIVNMFAGIGTYSIILAKKNPSCIVYSIDSNPTANELCLINSKLNKVEKRVIPLLGDANYVIQDKLRGVATRVLMPLPEKAYEFIDAAVISLKNRKGTVHFFAHIKANNKKFALDEGIKHSTDIFKDYQKKITTCKVVREVGPRLYQVVTDIYLL